jgi:hypothetical protein
MICDSFARPARVVHHREHGFISGAQILSVHFTKPPPTKIRRSVGRRVAEMGVKLSSSIDLEHVSSKTTMRRELFRVAERFQNGNVCPMGTQPGSRRPPAQADGRLIHFI